MKQARTFLGISVLWLALSMLTDGMTTLVLPALLLNSGDEASKATELGLVTFLGLLAGMAIQPLAGSFSDRLRPRWGRKGALAAGLALLLAALFVFGSSTVFPMIVIGFVLVQLTTSMVQAAQQGFIPDLIPMRQRGTASGIKNLMDVGGSMLGFLLLGQLLKAGQVGPALGAIATFLVVTFLVTYFLVREPRRPLPAAAQLMPNQWKLSDAYRLDMSNNRPFFWLVASRFLFLLATFGIGRFLMYFMTDRLGMHPSQAAEEAGFMLAGLALISVIAAVPAGLMADRFGRTTMMIFGALVSAAGAVLLLRANTSGDILIFGALLGIGSATFTTANWAMTTDLAPRAQAARFMGLANIGTGGAAAAAGLFGPLLDGFNAISNGATGYQPLFYGAAAAFLGSALILVMTRRRVSQSQEAASTSAAD